MSKRKQSVEDMEMKRMTIADPFCWLCHTANANVNCKYCIRAYHMNCIPGNDMIIRSDYRCGVCVRESLAQHKSDQQRVDVEHLNELLGIVTRRILESSDFDIFTCYFIVYPAVKNGFSIVNALDLEQIERKSGDLAYKTTLEYLNDIRWIRHNATVIRSEHSADMEKVRSLESLCHREMYDIEMCSMCFQRANIKDDWFMDVCSPPHLIVWARMKGDKIYKPGKVIGLKNTKIDVRFFDDYCMGEVLISDCLLYSKENPNRNVRLNHKENLELFQSMKNVQKHIKNIESKYSCSFIKFEENMPFDAKKIGTYLQQMIPNLELKSDFMLRSKPSYLNPLTRSKSTNWIYIANESSENESEDAQTVNDNSDDNLIQNNSTQSSEEVVENHESDELNDANVTIEDDQNESESQWTVRFPIEYDEYESLNRENSELFSIPVPQNSTEFSGYESADSISPWNLIALQIETANDQATIQELQLKIAELTKMMEEKKQQLNLQFI